MDLHSSLRSSVNTASEVAKIRKMERLAVISHSNMVNIVGLLTAHQEGQVLPCKNQEVGRCLQALDGDGIYFRIVQREGVLILHLLVKGLEDSDVEE